MEHRLSDILQFAPKNLQLYYKSSKLEQTVYFDEVYEHSDGGKYIIVNKKPFEIYLNSENEFIENSKLMVLDSTLTKSNLFPSEEYLSWVNWQYILFPKSIGAVVCGLDNKYFYIINENEMIDENKVIYNMCIESLSIFKYVDINETKFKDMDCSELISKRADLINETLIKVINNETHTKKPEEMNESAESEKPGLKDKIWDSLLEHMKGLPCDPKDFKERIYSIISNNDTQTAESENTDKPDSECLNNTDGFVFIANDWIEMIKDCKSKEEVIRAFSDKYGSDYVKKIEKFIPDYWAIYD